MLQLASLYLFHLIYFVSIGLNAFVPKLYGELGMTNGQIGVLTSLPTIAGLAVIPYLGAMTDRVPKKKNMLAVLLLCMAAAGFALGKCVTFLPLLVGVSVYTVFGQTAQPLATTITLEYTRAEGRAYGPIRLLGTVGYQVGALVVGAVLSRSLRTLYPLAAVFILLAVGSALMMPGIEGHQTKSEKVPMRRLFEDKTVCALYIFIFLATISTQFYASFYTKHLGDIGMSNRNVSMVTFLSVLLELPFLAFADKIAKRFNVWTWLLIGMLLNAVRWLGLAFATDVRLILLFQIPAVSVLACYEFFPALYLNRRVKGELIGSAQQMLNLTTFCLAKIVGSLIGGQICERISIPTVFIINSVLLFIVAAVGFAPLRKLMKADEGTVYDLRTPVQKG